MIWLGFILGTAGAAWFTLRQKHLQNDSPFTCLQLIAVIALVVSGMVLVVMGILKEVGG
jgi:drug/metabolite transporter (DMT)-like permease